MRYIEYTWDLEPERILFDEELDIDKLGWRRGDLFEIKNIDGRAMLVKLDPLINFLRSGERK